MKNNSIAPLVLLPLIMFLSVPALFLKQNLADVERLEGVVVVVFAAAAILSMAALLAVNALLRRRHAGSIFRGVVEFLCFFVAITGFVLPASESVGMVDPEFARINFPHLSYAAAIAGLMLWLARTGCRKPLYMGLYLFVALNTGISVYAIAERFYLPAIRQTADKNQIRLRASDKKNIFVLSFDGVPGPAVNLVLQKNPELAARFNGFTVFSRVAASSPATAASTAASLYGNRNFKAHYRTERELWDSAPDDLLTNFLNDRGYQVSTYGEYNVNFEDKARQHHLHATHGIMVSALMNYTLARTVTSLYVIPRKPLDRLEAWVRQKSGLFRSHQDSDFLQQVDTSKSPLWKKSLAATFVDFQEYVNKLELGATAPAAHFLHFTFTHFPVEFDRQCRYMGYDADWFERRQNWHGVQEETHCALLQYAEFIEKLKQLGIFEQSLVVLKSDHGKPVGYYDSLDILSETINGHDLWGYGRYAPFLAIKGFGAADAPLKANAAPVLLDDLARTICTAALGAGQCRRYPGFDLLKEPLEIPAAAKVTLFVVASKRSGYRYDSHIPVTVARQPGILRNLHEKLSAQKARPGGLQSRSR